MIAHVLKTRTSKRTLAQVFALALSLVVIAIVLSESASADLDTFTTGDGHEGAVTVSTNSVLNYSAPLNATAATGATSLTTGAGQTGAVGTAATTGSPAQTQFEANRLALVIQSSNYTGSAPSGNQTDIDLSNNSVGRWELARISSVTGSIAAGMTVNFANPLVNSYAATGAQIVAVPEFTTVQVNNTRSWSANAWNGTNGGITAFLANGAVNLNNAASSINANGDGFRGGLLYNGTASGCTQLDGTVGGGKGEGIVSGVYPGTATSYASRGNIANGGGGGVCENSGGGGGGNGGQGGIGGQSYDGSRNVGGLGGSKLNYSAFDHAIFGGGGGAGDENNSNGGAGGNGGGFVFVRADSLTGLGTISATGNAGSDSVNTGSSDAAGGGGAGGVVYARFNNTAACGSVSVRGGAGGNELSTGGVHGPGGGGAGGRLVLQSSGGTCPATAANGTGGSAPNGGGGTRGAGPTSSTDATSSGATEGVSGGGGISSPTAAVSTPADGAYTNSTTPTITGTSSMNAGTIRVSIDGVYVGSVTTTSGGAWTYTVGSALSAGAHTYTVTPVYYGLAGSATASRTINIDLTAPSAPTVSSNRSGTVSATTATITYTPAEAGGTMQCSLDGGAYATCAASPVALSGLADGNHSYAVRQVDAAGNVGSASTVAWVVDTVAPPAPTVTRTSPTSTPTSQTTAQITFSANEAGGTLQCSVDGGAYATCGASPANLSGLANGAHSYAVRQVDAAGNTGTATTVNWTVDTVAPAAPSVSSNRSGTVSATTATITYTPAEGGGTMQCSLDGGAYATCAASPVALSGLADGAHTYAVRQVDAAGNTGSSASVGWTVDTTAPPAPNVTRTTPAATPTNSTSAQITFSANEAGGTLQCSQDGGAYATCAASPVNLSSLADGAHSYAVRQVDGAGNTGAATTVNWTVDTAAPPAPTVSSNRTGSVSATTAQITFSANEAGGTLQCSQDGGAYATCAASPVNLSGLADGNHTYAVRQVDAAGNTGSATTVAWVVDTVLPPAPTVTRTSPASSPTTSTTAQITYSANEAGGTLQCSVDGGAYATCGASPANLSGLTDGAHSYAVRQVDAAGNTGTATTVNWTVDTAAPPAPTVTRTAPASTPTSSTSAQITFSANEAGGTLQCSQDGGAYATCAASPVNLSSLADGAHSYAVRQVDAAGNTGAATSVNWTVDTAAPAAPTVSSNRTGSVNLTTATITYTPAEGGGTMQCSLDGGAYATCTSSPIGLSGLADGNHSYAVRQVDAAGNTGSATTVAWVVDTALPPAPTVTRTSPASTPTSQTTAQITFSANEAGGTLQCSVDGGAYATCGASPANLSGLADGAHSYAVRQVDAATNTGPATTVNWTVDTVAPVAPTVTRTSPASSPTTQTTAQITYAANEGGGTLQCSVDGGAYATCGASPASLSSLTDGTHTYAVRQLDAAGNVGAVASVSWVVDTTPPVAPTVIRTSPTSSPTTQTTAQITYAANEAGGTLQCSVDGGAYATCGASPANLSGLADGSHSYAVRQVDGVGNIGSVASVAWVVDTTAPPAPTVTRTSPASTPTSQTTAQITFSANEAGGTLQCSVDGGAYATCGSSPASLSSLADGAHSYAVRQQDAAGNTSASTTVNWTVDTVAPAAPTVTSNRTGTVSATTATITYTPAEGGGTMQCSVDGGAYATCSASPIALSGLGDGPHTYAVRQLDAAGNTGSATTVGWTVDTIAPPGPTVTRTAPATTPTNSTTAQITYSANEAGGTLQCSVDGGAYANCTSSPANLSGLADGAHSYAVRQVDSGGNIGTATTVNWTVDTSPPPSPTVTRTSPTSTPTTQTTAQITFSANEAGGTLQCSVDGGAYTTCGASPASLSALADGNHSYAVRQVDAAGNTGSVSSVAWVVDTTAPPAPTVTRTTPASTPTSQTTAQITYSANEAGGTLQCSVDGGAYATCGASPANLSGLANGAHSYAVRQQDAAGNTSAVTTVNWTVDTIAPAAPTVSSNRSGTVNVTTATITYTPAEGGGTLQCSLDGGAYATCTSSPISLSALADGNHSYAVRQIDAAGNTGSATTVAWVVDTVLPPAPTVTRTSPTSTPTSQTTAQITFSANEAGGTLQCSVDGGAYASCGTSPANLSALADGAHSYAVRQVDAGTNTGPATTVNWTVDTVAPPAPTVTRTSPASTPTSQTTAQITYSANEAGGTLQCSVDGGAYATCGASPANLSGLADGTHSYAVRQVDAAGNTGAATTVNWTVDTTAPPAPTVHSNRTGTVNETTAQITFSANEAGGTLQCSLDGGAYATCASSPVNINSLADGNHSYAVRQVDAAGNTGSATTVAWIVDTVAPPAPTVTRTAPASTPTNQTTAQITFSANEAGGTLQCSVDGGAYATCGSSPANLSGLANGAHSYAVRQVDAGTNIGQATTVNWTVDTIAPAAPTVSSNRTGTVNVNTATITYTAAEGGGTMQCALDGGAYATCAASPVALSSLADGNHSYAVRQIDAAGNTGSATTVAWVVDTVAPPAPTVTRTAPASTPTSQTTAQITFSANEAGGTLQCAVDGGAYATCGVSPANLSGLSDGTHSYSVRQVDAGTNVGAATTVNWTVDTVAPPAPTVTRTTPASSPTTQTTAQITYSANEAGGTLQCSFDGGAYATCGASPANLSGLADGTHSYAVRQIDAAGNTGSATTVNWTVDTTPPPAPNVSSNRSGTVNVTTAQITFSANEAGGTLQCSLDGGAYATCAASPVNLNALTDGNHSYAVRQVDAAGNTGSATTVSWIVDTVAPAAPTVTRTSPASTPTSQTTAEITFSANEAGGTLQCSFDGGAYATCGASPANLSALADGPHSYSVRQVDAGNNIGQATTVSWTVDTGAPAAPTVTSNRTGVVSESTATITYTPSEPGGTLECSLDGAAYATCGASPIELTGLTDGPHTYAVRQLDDAGNADSAGTVAWVVDLTAPAAPAITAPAGSPSYSATANPTFSGTAEPNSTVKLFDGATEVASTTADASGDWSVASSALSEGAHAITAKATDEAGNTSSASAASDVVVDITTPTVAINSPATGSFVNTTSVSVDFSVTDANSAASSSCRVDGGAFVSCTTGFNSGTLTPGSHTITVGHTDLAGNTGSSSTTFTVDNATPTVTITSPSANAQLANAVVSVDFSVSDDNPSASSSCSVDGGAAGACSSPFETAALSDGVHSVTVSHTDTAGNTGSAVVSFTVDTTAPGAPIITDAPADPLASGSADFSFTGAEAGGTFECSIDGEPFVACTSPASFIGLTDGPHEFRVRQLDATGNDGSIATHNWTVDTTPPAAPAVSGPNAHTNNPESSVSFAGSPDSVELRCSFNGGPFSPCPASPLSLGTLADGDYTFAVIAFDAAGNSATTTISWEVDTVAPGAPTITAGPVGSVPSPDAQFAFTGAESGGLFRCDLNAQPSVNCTSPFDVTGLADGTYTFRVRQVDAAGNVGPAATRTWTVDTTPPPAPTVTGPASPSGQTSALINFADTEPGVTFMCSVDSGAYSACVDPLSLTGLSDGPHTVDARAYDAAGNGSAVGTFNWTVDHTLFTANISGAPSGVVNTTSASLTLSASLPGSTFTCSLDGAPYASCASPVSLSGLSEGSHTFKLVASNGPQDTPEVTRSWTVDLTNPSVTITAPEAASTTGPDTSVAFTTNDLHAPITTTCKLDGNPPAPCTSPQPFTNLTEGNHTVLVTATDAAGNAGSSLVTWHVDHTAPNAPAITVPAANGSTNNTTPTVSGSAEANSTVKLYDGATLLATIAAGPTGSWSWTPSTPLAEGTYNIHATATDAFDNVSDASATRTLRIDTSAPAAPVVTAPSAGVTNDATPLVEGTSEPGATVTVFLDGAPLPGTVTADVNGQWQKSVAPALTDGPHTISASATDEAGNDSATSSDVAITVDTAPPSVAITAPAAAARINTASPEITFTSDDGSTTRCKLDGGAFATCSSPEALAGVSEGAHSFTVEATDAAGNVATAIVNFTVDLTDPTVQLTGGPTAGADSSDDTPTFTFTSNEPGTFECAIDGGPYTPCTSPFTLPSLGDGPHTFAVRAVDQAGNESSSSTRSWTVDTTAPAAPSIDAPADNAVTSDNTPTVSGDAGSSEDSATVKIYIGGTLSGSATAAGDGSWSYTVPSNLSDNSYIFTATATDAAGNVSPVSNSVHIRVDAADPVAQITGKPGSLSNDSTPTFSFTADEPATFECKIDVGAWTACSSPFTTAALPDGAHQFFVRATDASNNVSDPEEWDWTSDTTAPTVTVTPNSPAAGLSPTFSFNSNESGTTYKCRIDGSGAFATCSSPFNAPTLTAGSHTLEVQFTDPAGNTGTKTVNFTVTAPPVTEPPATEPPASNPTPPAAQTCTGSGDEPGVAANMSVISAVGKKNIVTFTTSSDKYILVRVSIYDGKKLVGTAVRANNPGKRLVAIKAKKALAKNKKFTIRLSAITMTGGKSVVTTYLATDKKGKPAIVGADGNALTAPPVSTVDCAPEKGSKKIKVGVATKVSVKISDKRFAASAKATDWAIATFRVVQNGKTVARKVMLLKPNKKVRASLKALPGNQLVQGKAIIQVATCTVDGQWQLFKKPFTVK